MIARTMPAIMNPGFMGVNERWRYCKNGITDIRVETIRCGDRSECTACESDPAASVHHIEELLILGAADDEGIRIVASAR
jgi:hypothetical protein